jgi:hypothetical protein
VTVVLRSGHTEGVLVLSCSFRLLSATRAKREKGVKGNRWAQRQGEVRAWGGAKADGGRLHGCLDMRVCLDIRTLATSIREVSLENKGFLTYKYFR